MHPNATVLLWPDRSLCWASVGDRAGESVIRHNIATIYRNQDRLAEAVVEFRRVVELDRLVQHSDLERDRAMLAQMEEELAGQRKKRGKG